MFFWVLCSVAALGLAAAGIAHLRAAQGRRSLGAAARDYKPPANAGKDKRSFVVFANPNSGGGQAVWIVENVVVPMCEAAGVKVRVVLTTHRGHAGEVAATLTAASAAPLPSALVCVSGDGMVTEVLNAVGLAGPMDPAALRDRLHRLPIAIIPAGTMNGISTSLGLRDAVAATRAVLDNRVRAVDVSVLRLLTNSSSPAPTTDSSRTLLDLHAIEWGLPADCDYLTENTLRWMPLRSELVPPGVIARGRNYRGRLLFRPVPAQKAAAAYYTDPSGLPDAAGRPGFKELAGDFGVVLAMNLSHGASDMLLSPALQPDEGAVDIIVLRSIQPRLRTMFALMSTNNLAAGGLDYARYKDHVQVYKVCAYELHPEGGTVLHSGEVMPSSSAPPFAVDVVQGAAAFFY